MSVGDIVKRKDNGLRMVVGTIYKEDYELNGENEGLLDCYWYAESEIQREDFHPSVVEVVEEATQDKETTFSIGDKVELKSGSSTLVISNLDLDENEIVILDQRVHCPKEIFKKV